VFRLSDCRTLGRCVKHKSGLRRFFYRRVAFASTCGFRAAGAQILLTLRAYRWFRKSAARQDLPITASGAATGEIHHLMNPA
jgi:hypothetical protein